MAVVGVTHSKVVTIPDDPNYPVGSDEWNANHIITGLENIDNTSDANKPVSTAQAAAIALKAPLLSPAFTTPALGVATATSLAASKNGGGSNSAIQVNAATSSSIALEVSTAAADQKWWDFLATTTTMGFRAVNDANSSASNWMTATRGAGATVSSVSIPALVASASGGTASRTLAAYLNDALNILDFSNIDPTGVTDSLAGIQAALNANPNRTFYFGDASNTFKCSGPILLVDAAGHNFQGRLLAAGATITFTNAGASTDADSAMQHGFQVYPVTNALGGDITGARNVTIEGFNINCPTNGAGIYLANSQRCSFINNTFNGGRYGLAMETCINTYIYRNTFNSFINAGVGLIYSGDTTRVWYGSATTPLQSYWNDSPQIIGNGFTGTVTGGLAHILDMGSQSESIRNIQGNYFFNNTGCNQYGYIGRNCNPVLLSNWMENANYPIRILNSNAAEGGSSTTLTGVTAAQPGGTFTVGAFPDGFSFTARVENNFFVEGINDINLSGVSGGPSHIGGNISQLLTGFHLVSTQSGSQKIIDSGDTLVAPNGGVYSSLAFQTRVNLAGIVPWTAYAPTISAASGAFTTASATGRFSVDATGTTFFKVVIQITTNGTAAGTVNVTLPSIPSSNEVGVASGREAGVSGKMLQGRITASSNVLQIANFDNTYPGASGALMIINGFYN